MHEAESVVAVVVGEDEDDVAASRRLGGRAAGQQAGAGGPEKAPAGGRRHIEVDCIAAQRVSSSGLLVASHPGRARRAWRPSLVMKSSIGGDFELVPGVGDPLPQARNQLFALGAVAVVLGLRPRSRVLLCKRIVGRQKFL